MKRLSIGLRLYLSVVAIFLLFAVAFIVFQQGREKRYKVETLNVRLQSYNALMEERLGDMKLTDENKLGNYIKSNYHGGLRVTLIRKDGAVVYDNVEKDYRKMGNHLNRPEVAAALKGGSGYSVDRNSSTLGHDYFYSATYYPAHGIIVRSALPYNDDLMEVLGVDRDFLWFALAIFVFLTYVLYRFTGRLGRNINQLRLFAKRADHNESLDTDDLLEFQDDELGEIAERIIKLYKRLQSTRQEQDELKRELTQNIAHELKTPVASIQGYLETILEKPDIDNETKKQFLERCYAQSRRLSSLLRDISTLNRMDDAPHLMKDAVDVDIVSLVEQIRNETRLEMQNRNMNFNVALPPRLVIHGNHSLLYSVFRNLTDNAIAYAGEGTTVTLTAEKDSDNGKWEFVFADNGVGVPARHLPRLFERFYRVDKGRSRSMGGTGLGLAIVKNAVLLHGGTIKAENAPESGLRITFTLSCGQ